MSNPAWLLVRTSLTPEWGYELAPGQHQIGRAKLCQIRLTDESVSREHAMIDVEDGRMVLHDLGSRNGTFIDGKRIDKQIINVGDRIRVGIIELDIVKDYREAQNLVIEDEETTLAGNSRLAKPIQERIDSLTEAQRRVLALVLRGNSEKEMAQLLFISVNTIHNHVRKLYEKFEVASRPELMAIFIHRP